MTDPPLLGLWVAIESFRKHRMWIEWTMDLYPEAFAAAGLSSPDGVLYTFVLKALQKWKPVRYICLGPLQHRWIRAHREIDRPAFILPCGTCDVLPGDVPAWRTDDRIILAYAGNLGEAHSADVVAQIVTRADPRRFAFVLATYGAKVAGLRERTRGFANITWCSHLSHSDLAHADVHIVSLLGKWAHICVPSKAVAAVCLGRPILFAGPPDTDTWNQLGSAGWLIAETSDGGYETRDIDRALEGIGTGKEREYKTQQANSLRSKLRLLEGEELGRIVGWLAQFAGRGDPGHAALKPDDISTDSMIGARTATGPNRGES
jgi:hypothetical protein